MDRPDGRLNAWILAWAGHAFWTRAGIALPGAELPPAARRLRVLGEPAPARHRARAGAAALRPGPRVQPRARSERCVVSGLGAYLLVRRVSDDRLAAFFAAAYFAAGPHRWTRLSHLHAQMTLFLPFALLAFDAFWRRRTLRARARRRPGARAAGRWRPSTSARSPPPRSRLRRSSRCSAACARASSRGSPPGSSSRRRSCGRVDSAVPAHARVRGAGVHARDRRGLRGLAALVRGGRHRGVGAAVAAARRPLAGPRHAVPGPRRARAGRRRARRGAAALPRRRRRGLGRRARVLARPRHRPLPLPPRARGPRARASAPSRASRSSPRSRCPSSRASPSPAAGGGSSAAAIVLAMVESENLPLRARPLRRARRRPRAGSPGRTARCSCCRSATTTRAPCSTASPTAARS